MIKLWHKIQRQYFSYSRSDRNALILLASILLLLIAVNIFLPLLEKEPQNDFSELQALIDEWERSKLPEMTHQNPALFEFDPNTISGKQLDSLDLPYFVKQNILKFRAAGGRFKEVEDLAKIYGVNDSIFEAVFRYVVIKQPEPANRPAATKVKMSTFDLPFDPNFINADSLLLYGFSTYQANNLVKYRENGGSFKVPEDILKIYGIDSVFYQQVKAYIQITPGVEQTIDEVIEIGTVELNGADSSDLMALPGIGPVYATRIIKYRDLLGGYYSTSQLLEVYNFPIETYEQISEHVTADTVKLKKLRLNFLGYTDLIRHPYLNKQQVSELLTYRQMKGAFKNLDVLEDLEGFDAEMLDRLRPYITSR
jgi:DNA uptake protein ComE-like DNA-binding protein